MRRAHLTALATAACGLVMAGCSDPEPTAETALAVPPALAAPPLAAEPLTGLAHQTGADLYGFYFPVTEVAVGPLKLSHFYIAAERDFVAWEAVRRGPDAFAPVMFQFDDTTSTLVGNDLGGQGYSVTERVLPDAYVVSEGEVRFAGRHPQLGEVTFDGRLDAAGLAAAKAGQGSDAPVLTGVLVVGGRTFEGQSFRWYAGD